MTTTQTENDGKHLVDTTHLPRKPSDLDRIIGARLRKMRRRLNVSQTSAGESVGISFPQIQKYETGANRISVSTLIRLSKALGIKPEEFIASVCAEFERASNPPESSEHW